ncbi:hypothetical protein ACQP0C_09965 [Nocardia sp. CA-129566]|uniref:hypothetical protein n=1 Tax=Nocardia sp. CA-129566 TaxID=3239976 RepID=UPI003D98D62A
MTFASVALCATVALLLVLRFLPTMPVAARGSVLGELRVFADRGMQLAIALTALGNVGVVTVFTYFTPLLTDIGGFAPGAVPVCYCWCTGRVRCSVITSVVGWPIRC